jgi:putative oxidoreductase
MGEMPAPETERLVSSPVSCARLVHDLISAPDERVSRQRVTRWVALLTGVTFVVAGLVKFVFHHWELHAFRSFGLPWPSALEIFAGVLETVGGILLARRRAVVPAATLLGVTMVVAIISSGIGHGDVIPSLTLAPALLLATLFLVVRGLGFGGARRA